VLGGEDSVTEHGRFLLLEKVTEEPVAKPAHWAGFSIFEKEAQIKASTFLY
jgi:hypothetical protein